jgi:hypothetical protein
MPVWCYFCSTVDDMILHKRTAVARRQRHQHCCAAIALYCTWWVKRMLVRLNTFRTEFHISCRPVAQSMFDALLEIQ